MGTTRPIFRVTAFGLFVAAFLCLGGSAVAVLIGQFNQSKLAPMLSIGYSAGAVACTIAALANRRRP